MRRPNARISRVHNSWRVRVFGHPPRFFADSKHGGKKKALAAARKWRDLHWNGKDRTAKLTPGERAAIRSSDEDYKAVAEKYGIHPGYVHQLRRSKS